jgi:hypothetical protein
MKLFAALSLCLLAFGSLETTSTAAGGARHMSEAKRRAGHALTVSVKKLVIASQRDAEEFRALLTTPVKGVKTHQRIRRLFVEKLRPQHRTQRLLLALAAAEPILETSPEAQYLHLVALSDRSSEVRESAQKNLAALDRSAEADAPAKLLSAQSLARIAALSRLP